MVEAPICFRLEEARGVVGTAVLVSFLSRAASEYQESFTVETRLPPVGFSNIGTDGLRGILHLEGVEHAPPAAVDEAIDLICDHAGGADEFWRRSHRRKLWRRLPMRVTIYTPAQSIRHSASCPWQ